MYGSDALYRGYATSLLNHLPICVLILLLIFVLILLLLPRMYVCMIYIYIYIWVLIRIRCIAGMQGVTEGLSGITSAESGGIGVKSGVSGLGKVGGSLLSGLKADPSYLSATRPKSSHKH